jgi:filamentous hemagglutinin family protein
MENSAPEPRFYRFSFVSACLLLLLAPFTSVRAQIIPDRTLGAESSVVTTTVNIKGIPSDRIDGGTIRGANLFHSFQEFNIGAERGAYFTNPAGIENILSRVTGTNPSNILGTLGVLGKANLFLINPKGIIFGPNARLDVSGSFLASTADSINFADGTAFSATNPQAAPLLTLSIPIGLQFTHNPGTIQVQGLGHNLGVDQDTGAFDRSNRNQGLAVPPGKTLALVGGDVVLEGGNLTAPEGRIELGSVGDNSLVKLMPVEKGYLLGYTSASPFRDIQFFKEASADASGEGGGEIQVQGRNVTLSDGSVIVASTLGAKQGGTFTVRASETLDVAGTTADGQVPGGLYTETLGAGKAADITIAANRVIVQDGTQISATTIGAGNTGDLTIRATESVEAISMPSVIALKSGFVILTVIGTVTNPGSAGNGGNMTIETGRLSIRGGAQVTVDTFGSGKGGNLTVRAKELEVLGQFTLPQRTFRSQLSSDANRTSTGDAGYLTIETGQLVIRDGGEVTTRTLGQGRGGTLTINATEAIALQGDSSLSAQSTSRATGQAGDLQITTRQLQVLDGAVVDVSSRGSGGAGNLRIQAGSIRLNRGQITAATQAGQGNIDLQSQDLVLRHGSNITTNALGSQVIGGNININTGVLAALEDSDISANSADFRGGKVTINAQGIFGTKFRPQDTPESDITATGGSPQLSGSVTIYTPDVQLQNALAELSPKFVSTQQVVASSCLARRNVQRGSFTVTGTGGLPRNPYQNLSGWYEVTDVQEPTRDTQQKASSPNVLPQASSSKSWKLGDPIIEAQGMSVSPDGRIIVGTAQELVAQAQAQDLVCDTSPQPVKLPF